MIHIGIKSAGLLLGGSLLVSGCATSETVAPEQSVGIDAAVPVASNPCYEFAYDANEEDATRCETMQHTGKVALVGYGISLPELKRVASESESLISQATNNMISVDIVPMLAAKPQIAAAKLGHRACASSEFMTSLGNITETYVNYDPKNFDLFVGATDKPACPPHDNAGGIFYGTAEGRDITLFNMSATTDDVTGSKYDAATLAHELFHAYGLGHANMLIGSSLEAEISEASGGIIRVVVNKLVRDGSFVEYGEPQNIMGRFNPNADGDGEVDTELLLNGPQKAWLRDPNAHLGKTDSSFNDIQDAPTDAVAGMVYVTDLEKPIHVSDFVGSKSIKKIRQDGTSLQYDKIAIYRTTQNAAEPVLGVYLLAANHDTVQLGYIFSSDTADKWELALGSKSISIVFDGSKAAISLKDSAS